MGTGEGFGKTILLGEATLHLKSPAIVAALAQTTVVDVSRKQDSGWTLKDDRPEVEGYKSSKLHQQRDSIERVARAMGIDLEEQGLSITFWGELLAGSGIGASAASCVALARALNDEFNLGFSDDGINTAGFEGDKAYHGEPAGIDNTASTYGGVFWFQRSAPTEEGQKYEYSRFKVGAPMDIVMANSGVNVNTSKVVAFKKQQFEENREIWEAAAKATLEHAHLMKAALESADKKAVGRLMDEQHDLLRKLQLSHDRIERIMTLAHQKGALGAKVTGGAMGGYTVILAEDEENQSQIEHTLREDGFQVFSTRIMP